MAAVKKVGNYQLIAEIKRGEHGATYRGWDAQNQRVVLIKTFKSRGEGCSPRFAREAEAYSHLDHPNVVKLWDYGFDEGTCFLALEFVAGQDLRRVLQPAGALPVEIAMAILHEALHGLAEIHKQNIIHRDLKPENILLSHNGEVKLCDFDLALQEEEAAAGLTGSPGYVAPEVILGEKITPLADIFSLGVVFYEMLAGARPFQAATPGGEMNAIVRLAHLPLNKFSQNAPGVEELLAQMLAKRATERCATARAAQQRLEQQFELGTHDTRAQLIRRYLEAPEQYQTAGLIVRAQPTPATKAGTAKRGWAYAAGFAGILLLSMSWLYWRAQRETGKINQPPLASLQEQKVKADSSFNGQSFDAARRAEERKAPTISAANPVVKTSAMPESTAVFIPPTPVVRTILMRSNPWAYFFLNGDSLGMTPLTVTMNPATPPQQLALRNPQFPRVEIALRLETQTSDTITFSLWEQVAQLELQITPWAEVYINDEKRALAEGEKSLLLLPGRYNLRFVHAQLGEKTETIALRAGEVRRLAVNMF